MTKNQKIAVVPALAAVMLLGGAIAGYTGLALAQTPASATGTTSTMHQFNPTKGGHVGQNGTRETLLTGDSATKATTAALAAVPGGTVDRVETDAEGDAYEAHMTKADGTHVTVKFDSSFNVTKTEDGPGPRAH